MDKTRSYSSARESRGHAEALGGHTATPLRAGHDRPSDRAGARGEGHGSLFERLLRAVQRPSAGARHRTRNRRRASSVAQRRPDGGMTFEEAAAAHPRTSKRAARAISSTSSQAARLTRQRLTAPTPDATAPSSCTRGTLALFSHTHHLHPRPTHLVGALERAPKPSGSPVNCCVTRLTSSTAAIVSRATTRAPRGL